MKRRGLVLAGAAVLFLWWLGGHDVWAPDEPYFAEGAREMVVDGRWAVPHVNGVVTPDKPPLFFWLIALLSLPAGEVTPLTARLPSALAALGTLALLMRLGARFYGPRTAALAGAILATTFMFWDKARWSQTDSLLCFWIWLALTAFASWRAGEAAGRRAGLVFWLAAALAVLTKGPVGVLLPLGIALVVLAADRELGRWRGFAPWLGPGLFALVLAGWVAWTELGGPAEYSVWGALREHFVDRGIHGMHHKQPFWYFFERLPQSLLPWTGLVPGALLLAWRRRRPADRLLLAVVAFVVVFFSISTEKRELYALPSLPAFALLAAALVGEVAGWRESAAEGLATVDRRWVTAGLAAVAVLLGLVAVAMPLAVERAAPVPPGRIMVLAALVGATALATLALAWQRRALGGVVALAAGIAGVYLFAVTAVYPALEPIKSARSFSLRIQEAAANSPAAGKPVVAYRLDNLPEHFAFHTGGLYTIDTGNPEVLRRHLERSEPRLAVVHGGELEPLPEALIKRLYLVAETRLARRPVLLVANFAYPGAAPLR